jgi:hypothetical protein
MAICKIFLPTRELNLERRKLDKDNFLIYTSVMVGRLLLSQGNYDGLNAAFVETRVQFWNVTL